MKNKSIKYITEKLGAFVIANNQDDIKKKILDFSTDTRALFKGSAFVALKGENYDGHEFINIAFDLGASACIVNENWYKLNKGKYFIKPLIVVNDTLQAFGDIANDYRNNFIFPIIAVAGSNGKTTTKELLSDILSSKYNVLRTEGNLNNLIGLPNMLLRLNNNYNCAVLEIGTNSPGEIERLSNILNPTHGTITNIGKEHLELLKNLKGVAKEEGELFNFLKNNNRTSFVNLDDIHISKMGKSIKNKFTYGKKINADLKLKVKKINEYGAPEISLSYKTGNRVNEIISQLKTPGVHTAINATAATAIALELGVSKKEITKVLKNFEPTEYKSGYARLSVINLKNSSRILNDTYNSNPDSTLVALKTLFDMKIRKGGKRIVVLGDMKELGKMSKIEHESIGIELSKLKLDNVYFYGEQMKYAYKKFNDNSKGIHYISKEKLINDLKPNFIAHDILLVKGSRGMKMEEVVNSLSV